MNFVQIVDFDWLPWQRKCEIFEKQIFKNLLLRSHKGDEAETLHKCLCYYPLDKVCFYCCCARGFVSMATLSFQRFIMGKVKVDLYFYLTLGILTKSLQ